MPDYELVPAAQYLRMSTRDQVNSIPIQRAAIATYAAAHNYTITETYVDPGCSGLTLRGRPGLRALLADVVRGTPKFRAILVYDVSRWGRFQDNDEAAHYEFLCKRNGMEVHYCAEHFTNDVTMANMIMKALKRTMAAEYSRELSVKAYEAQRRVARAGFHVGGMPGYGFRRMLLSKTGEPKQVLEYGDHKNLRADRVKIVKGPPEELAVIRSIYRLFLRRGMSVTEIVRELERQGIKRFGQRWSFDAVEAVLTQPKYIGTSVWGRTSRKLGTAPKWLPRSEWLIRRAAFPALVSRADFSRAQTVLRRRGAGRSDEELLTFLRDLLAKNGRLSHDMVELEGKTPAASSYKTRFGGLREAYRLIGYEPEAASVRDLRYARRRALGKIRAELLQRLLRQFAGCVRLRRLPGRQSYLRVDDAIDVAITVCRSYNSGDKRRWMVIPTGEHEGCVTVLCLLNPRNTRIEQLYVFPRLGKSGAFRLQSGAALFAGSIRLHTLRHFYRAVVEGDARVPVSDRHQNDTTLIGLHEIARFCHRSWKTVRRWRAEGLPTWQKSRYVFASPDEVRRWVRKNHPEAMFQENGVE